MTEAILVPAEILAARLLQVLTETGASAESAEAATKAMMHGSRIGIDSHGVRLVAHYVSVLKSGRVNPRPSIVTRRTSSHPTPGTGSRSMRSSSG